MKTLSKRQREVAELVNLGSAAPNWTDWKWQIRHAVKDVDTFEKLLDVRLGKEKRNRIEQTLKKFPMSITPYYLSLIDSSDM